jgi:hypothetical protein
LENGKTALRLDTSAIWGGVSKCNNRAETVKTVPAAAVSMLSLFVRLTDSPAVKAAIRKRALPANGHRSEPVHDVAVSFRFFHAAHHFAKSEIAHNEYIQK